MANSKIFSVLSLFSIYIIVFLMNLQQNRAMKVADNPLFHICSNSGNFSLNSKYQKNLDRLLIDLYLKTPKNNGFGSSSVAGGGHSDRTYGLSLCRGDVSTSDCQACVVEAGGELHRRCPNSKGSIIWYDNCLLKYSEDNFLGKIDNTNKFNMYNVASANKTDVFNRKTKDLLGELAEKAAYDGSKTLYATGEADLGGGVVSSSEKLYGLVQCTRDLSGDDCKKCLDVAIAVLPSCCDGKEGGRVVGGSCNIRYETYPFVRF